MADHPATHAQPKADPKTGAAPAPYDGPPPPTLMNVGDTGTVKVSFTDEAGGAINIASSTWTSTGSVTIVPDDKDPTSAALTAAEPGRASIEAAIVSDSGAWAEAAIEVMVIQPKIDVTVAPASKSKAK